VSGMLVRYYREEKGGDPIVHFYETFLAYYDPEERERRGVYYTPEPVVSYIVHSLHALLKEKFGMADGLASKEVTLLDPAAGTMTFVARAAETATHEFTGKYGAGGRKEFLRTHILRNYYAFELMMAPYAVGHLKMAFFLEELGHRLDEDERIPFYLTNTLEMTELEASKMPLFSSLAEESHLAGRVKHEQPILAILGNPPYSGHSANKGQWILQQIEEYKQVDGKPLGEKNPKWLQDDYVKFLRFAQWKIEQAGRGIVGMITNHSYLDNPTFRGMRRSLMKTFDEIYVLDLHGNSLKRETCPDGSKDENVFDIRQGVAIAFFVKTGEREEAAINHAELWGLREVKYKWLAQNDVSTTSWIEIHPRPEFYLFVPRDEVELERYSSFPSVTDIFEKYSTGIFTARDRLTIHWTPEEVWTTVLNFSRLDPELARQAYRLGKDARDWKVTLAQQDLHDSGAERDKVVPILYRPFDVRYTYYTGHSRGFICMPRPEVMRHMLAAENVALCVGRQGQAVGGNIWNLVFVSAHIEDLNLFYRGGNVVFPLYLYPDAGPQTLFGALEPQERRPNIGSKVFDQLAAAYGHQPAPEQVFHYIYAVLYAPSYRERYAEFLRMDFPRIPFPDDRDVFVSLAELGQRLVDLHLLRSPELNLPLARFEGKGDCRIAKTKRDGFGYDPQTERVYINLNQYFAPVPLEVWVYRIGGYQVCEKWLKDRRERILGLDEIRNYCRIVTALARTIEIQEEIDALYSRVEEELLILRL
ncbi:MAG: DNA methyltransferase, partial [Deltaproteobacteria bacterium]